MFKYDIPIEKPEEDILSRKKFSKRISETITNWDGKESLVIAIYGEWGYGKSSTINLVKYYVETSNQKNTPTVLEFNPWLFSDIKNLTSIFFYELSKELEIKEENDNDKKLAKRLRFFANILAFLPDKSIIEKIRGKLLVIAGLIGISASKLFSFLGIGSESINNIILIGGVLFLILEITREYISKTITYFHKKIEKKEKTRLQVKKEIKESLKNRQKKLLIIIDDVDRLNTGEIKDIFKLLKSNADFPNTIYLLAFDRKVIVENLQQQPGINGNEYLEKIIQVNFDIPHVSVNKLSKFLFSELDRVLNKLPESHTKYFDTSHWAAIYNSGYKNLFTNIRVIKRYINSLEFNISLMHQGNSMEVNPIDFFALEAIRIFIPSFYLFMKNKKTLFTETTSSSYSFAVGSDSEINKRKDEIEDALKLVDETHREGLRELIKRLFPQLQGVYENYHYSGEYHAQWTSNLRICSPTLFDVYFTLIPGGDEDELNQYEIDQFLENLSNPQKLEEIIDSFKAKNKLRSFLERIQNYTSDKNKISIVYAENLFTILFNISDDLPKERKGMFDLGADWDIVRIIFQILKRNKDLNQNFEILVNSIKNSKSLHGPIHKISITTSKEEKTSEYDRIIPIEKYEELKKIGLHKIRDFAKDLRILYNNHFEYILFRWKEWGNEKEINEFLDSVKNDDKLLIKFVEGFTSESHSHSSGEYIERVHVSLDKKNLETFISLNDLEIRLNKILEKNLDDVTNKRVDHLLTKLKEKPDID